jgi:glycosyltransferase involved in cell wall biosynthesis
MPYDLSIVIPAHNESARLGEGLAQLIATLSDDVRSRTELIVVDDGSSDDTSLVAQRALAILPHFYIVRYEVNRGKGGALKVGIAAATGRHVVCVDADAAIDSSQIPLLQDALSANPVAVGSRAVGGKIIYDSALRTWGGSVFNFAVRRWSKIAVRDTQCGFKGYSLAAARLFAIFGTVDGFAFDVEWLVLARQLDLPVSTVSVTWRDVAGSSVRVGRDSLRMLREIRHVTRTSYRTVGIRIPAGQTASAVEGFCRQARVQGGVIARGVIDDLVVLPRDAATAAIGVGEALGGSLCVVTPALLRGRILEAI